MPSAAISIQGVPDHARVLIVDDSAVARAVIAQIVDGSDRYVAARTVSTAAAALEFLADHQVEFILLDVQMPGVDGLTALPDLLAAAGDARIVVVSSTAEKGAVTTVQALALGAADTLEKPVPGERSAHFAASLIEKLDRLWQGREPHPVPAAALPPPRPTVERAPLPPMPRGLGAFDVVAIGASTGGIHALGTLLRQLPASFRTPIIITQHLPASFMPYFAAQVAVLAGRPCDVAVDRMRIRQGRVVVAPGDAHLHAVPLGDGEGALRLNRDPVPSGCMPSVDPMLASLAHVYRERLLAVVLSGMGRDGAEGAHSVREAGGALVVQDRQSSVIWGMPGAVAQGAGADAILDPEAIGRLVAGRRRP